MDKGFRCLSLLTIFVWSVSSFAATSYVVTDNNGGPNTISAFSLNTTSGLLSLSKRVRTGGGGGATIDAPLQAVSNDARCVFAVDTVSNDIAALAAPSYNAVGKFSNSALIFSRIVNDGGGIALAPSGKFLYGAYYDSQNIGAWQVNADCSLTLLAVYVPPLGINGNLGVSPNGRTLVVPSGSESAESFAIGSTGELTDLGSVSFDAGVCAPGGCEPTGVDFTRDSKVVLFNSIGSEIAVLAANVETSGALTNPQAWNLSNNTPEIGVGMSIFLGAKAYNGSGFLYLGFLGGVMTANFTENPLNVTFANLTSIDMTGGITVTGDILLVADDSSNIRSFRINADGSLTALSQVFDNNSDALSLSVYPNTR